MKYELLICGILVPIKEEEFRHLTTWSPSVRRYDGSGEIVAVALNPIKPKRQIPDIPFVVLNGRLTRMSDGKSIAPSPWRK